MKFKVRDKVAVLDAAIKGVVVGVEKTSVSIKDFDGMVYVFDAVDLILLNEDQGVLLKYGVSDAKFLREKTLSEKPKKSAFKKHRNEVVMEVDLHASKLVKSTRGMDNYDVLNLQLEAARRKIEYCIDKKISKLILIHGVGEGVLKSELHFLLNKYPIKYYDASYKEYGLGATEVYVYQNA